MNALFVCKSDWLCLFFVSTSYLLSYILHYSHQIQFRLQNSQLKPKPHFCRSSSGTGNTDELNAPSHCNSSAPHVSIEIYLKGGALMGKAAKKSSARLPVQTTNFYFLLLAKKSSRLRALFERSQLQIRGFWFIYKQGPNEFFSSCLAFLVLVAKKGNINTSPSRPMSEPPALSTQRTM